MRVITELKRVGRRGGRGTVEGQDERAEESVHDGNIDGGISADEDLSVFFCVKCDHMSIEK